MMATILSGYFQWCFRVSAVSFLIVSWGSSVWVVWSVFVKLQVAVFPAVSRSYFCVGVFHGDILLFMSCSILGNVLVAISNFQLSLYLYYYLLLFSLCIHVQCFCNCNCHIPLCLYLYIYIYIYIYIYTIHVSVCVYVCVPA